MSNASQRHPERRARVIINTDAKNEADDQFAIVHALLTPSFDIRGVIPAHFGDRRSSRSMEESREEVDLLLDLMGWQGKVLVADGAPAAMPDEVTPVPSPGAELIVNEALRDDPRPLHVAFYGPLTDMASALLMEPRIQERDIRVVWIGGGPWPAGGREFNLSNDIPAANAVFRSSLEVWQIPSPVYRRMTVSYAELEEKVAPCGRLGRYLVDQLIEWNARRHDGPMEYRSLGDSPAVGVMMYPDCGNWEMRPAPEFTADMHYVHPGRNREIRVYESVDARFILEDFFAKLRRFAPPAPSP
ncbi:nucleoside hydrolase [Actinopolymorpha alba]|uniref:nucleoside hydrolase n=1 Tax=Actinopolymorpha alba TaxID=533267 RepID=UPI0003725E8E|nr:nucleoside hydrolase [Actinopolymorpha alba]